MVLTSLQVCMDASAWLQGVNHKENGTDSSSQSGEDIIITSSKDQQDKLRPPSEKQVIKCPRCESTYTKFCYYNNYSLSQPRYFCKTCRRYWTKGGSLRNIPVGGGCRKNKRVTAKKSSERPSNAYPSSSSSHGPTDLQLSFPDVNLSNLTNFLGGLENSNFMESRFDALLGNATSCDFIGNNELNLVGDLGDVGASHGFTHNFYGFCPTFGLGDTLCENNGNLVTTNERQIVPFGESQKPDEVETMTNKFFSLDWPDYGSNEATRKDSVDIHLDSMRSWNAVMDCYGSSTTKTVRS